MAYGRNTRRRTGAARSSYSRKPRSGRGRNGGAVRRSGGGKRTARRSAQTVKVVLQLAPAQTVAADQLAGLTQQQEVAKRRAKF